MNIYLDIEQVLKPSDQEPALYIGNFLKMITKHPTFWLIADYRGSIPLALKRLLPLLNSQEINLITTIRHAEWDLVRTEAIDFTSPFLWLTRSVDEFELVDLQTHNCRENVHFINVGQDPHALKPFTEKLPVAVQPDITHSPYKHKLFKPK